MKKLILNLIFMIQANVLLGATNTFLLCHSDYHLQIKFVLHYLPENIVKTLEELTETPEQGWRLLGEYGDTYAAIAEKVLQQDSKPPYIFYRKLIRNHWLNTAGEQDTKKKFYSVAKLHYAQYIQIVKTGFWPDSDQILNSYLNAIRKFDLRDITVFDAAWDASGMNKVQTWQSLNKISSERTVFPTMACFDVDTKEARKVLRKDFNMNRVLKK